MTVNQAKNLNANDAFYGVDSRIAA